MQVILLEKVGRLGLMGEMVTVKDGFARNFLIPQKKALRATKENTAHFEAERANIEARNAKQRDVAQQEASRLDNLAFDLIRQASEDGKLYGSVTVRDIAEALQERGFDIARKHITLRSPIVRP